MNDPETDLWRAVLCRAIADAKLDDTNNVSDWDCAAARNFLLRDTRDFNMVAQLAGYEPTWLRSRLKAIL